MVSTRAVEIDLFNVVPETSWIGAYLYRYELASTHTQFLESGFASGGGGDGYVRGFSHSREFMNDIGTVVQFNKSL